MTRIIQGVLDFQRKIFGSKKELFEKLGKGQKPLALFITCSDSRITPDLLAQTQPGELFVLRNAGNIVPEYSAGAGAEAATIEYAVRVLKVRDIILCGHAKCGAMHGLIEPAGLATLPSVSGWLKHAEPVLPRLEKEQMQSPEEKLNRTIELNVLVQLEHLRGHPAVAEALGARTIRLHGWVYHFEQGKVDAYDAMTGRFVGLQQKQKPEWLSRDENDKTERGVWETHC
jgi:carbonic anhydrase